MSSYLSLHMYITEAYCSIFPAGLMLLLWLTALLCVSFAGLCPDWETWDPVKPTENATEAMQLADDWLGIPQVRFPPMLLHTALCFVTVTFNLYLTLY